MPAGVVPPVNAATDWEITDAALRAKPTRWRSLSWISARALIDAVNQSRVKEAAKQLGILPLCGPRILRHSPL